MMNTSPETPIFNPDAFTTRFFAQHEAQVAALSVEDQASAALANILTVEKADGTQKSYEELRDETDTFFANEWVRNDEAVLNRMILEFAQACLTHAHGSELARDPTLGAAFERGLDSLFGATRDTRKYGRPRKKPGDSGEDSKLAKKKKRRGWFGVYH